MRVTIAEVAQRAQVSKATVSRVLNGKPDVDATTAQRVRKVIDEIGYVPSARAVGLARGRTRTVGMLAPSLTWPWMGEVMQGIVDTLEADGYGLLLYTLNRGPESLNQFANHVSANAFDGLLVVEPPDALHYISTLYRAGLPVVMIDDPGNLQHPPQWFARTEQFACLCPAPFFSDEHGVEPGAIMALRYGVVIADGGSDPERAARLAEAGSGELRALMGAS
jgi:DNA-binding LacI/PurR family transcriptional regulator